MHDRSFPASLASTVRQRRRTLKLSQTELAELAGCSTRMVHALEAGKSTLRLDKLIAVLRALGIGLALELPRDAVPGSTRGGAP